MSFVLEGVRYDVRPPLFGTISVAAPWQHARKNGAGMSEADFEALSAAARLEFTLQVCRELLRP